MKKFKATLYPFYAILGIIIMNIINNKHLVDSSPENSYLIIIGGFFIIGIMIFSVSIYMNEIICLNENQIVIEHKFFWWRKKILIDLREIENILINSYGLYKKYTFTKQNRKTLSVKFLFNKQNTLELQDLFHQKNIQLVFN